MAAEPMAESVQPGQVGAAVKQSMFRALSTAGQYVVPLVCMLGALASFLGRRKRRICFLTWHKAILSEH